MFDGRHRYSYGFILVPASLFASDVVGMPMNVHDTLSINNRCEWISQADAYTHGVLPRPSQLEISTTNMATHSAQTTPTHSSCLYNWREPSGLHLGRGVTGGKVWVKILWGGVCSKVCERKRTCPPLHGGCAKAKHHIL